MMRRKMRTKTKYLLDQGGKTISLSSKGSITNLRKCETDRKMLLDTLQKAFLKHTVDETEIGWQALGELMGSTLAEVMGDKEFCDWIETRCPEKAR
jgi:hypothetical protein